MISPYFSVLIPTKNRSELVGGAIDSLLAQTFTDFEITVADNDDSEDTSEVLVQYDDPRLRYFRTGGLSMVENWEFGRKQCKGRYLTVLEDKLTFYPWSLEKIHQVLESRPCDAAVWGVIGANVAGADDYDALEVLETNSAAEILNDYVLGKKVWKKTPRLINSCISATLIDRVIKIYPGGAFFNYASPDLVAAFTQLMLLDEIPFIDKNLVYQRANTSASSSVRVNKSIAVNYFSGNSGYDIRDCVSMVPIKNYCLIQNTVYNDFLNTRRLLGGKLEHYRMSDYVYARICLRDIYATLSRGGNISTEIRDVARFMDNTLTWTERASLWLWWLKLVVHKHLVIKLYRPMRSWLSRRLSFSGRAR